VYQIQFSLGLYWELTALPQSPGLARFGGPVAAKGSTGEGKEVAGKRNREGKGKGRNHRISKSGFAYAAAK